MAFEDSRENILLDWSWNDVFSKLNVILHDRMQASVLERSDGVDSNAALLDDLELGNTAGMSVMFESKVQHQTYFSYCKPLVT
jgi:hypothetical protein